MEICLSSHLCDHSHGHFILTHTTFHQVAAVVWSRGRWARGGGEEGFLTRLLMVLCLCHIVPSKMYITVNSFWFGQYALCSSYPWSKGNDSCSCVAWGDYMPKSLTTFLGGWLRQLKAHFAFPERILFNLYLAFCNSWHRYVGQWIAEQIFHDISPVALSFFLWEACVAFTHSLLIFISWCWGCVLICLLQWDFLWAGPLRFWCLDEPSEGELELRVRGVKKS